MINRDEYKGIKSEGHTLKPQVSSVLSHLCWANQSGSTSVCPITADCGQGYGSTPFFSDRKTEAQSPVVGIEEKKKKKNRNALPRGCPKSRTIRGYRGLPHFISLSAIPNQPPLLWKQSSRPPQRLSFFMHPGKCSPPSVTHPRHKPPPRS